MGRLTTVTLELKAAQSHTSSQYVKCGNERGNIELPPTTK